MAAVTVNSVGNTWTSVAADVTALTLIQCVAADGAVIELQTAGSAPAETTYGIRMANMDTMGSIAIGDLGAGALYARRISGNNVRLLTLAA